MSEPRQVPFCDLHRLYLEQREELDEAVRAALGSGHYILGSRGQTFEGELRAFLGAPGHVRGCNSGTDALVLALRALGIGPGDEVACPSHTAIPTITAIRSVGAEPVFAEVNAESWVLEAPQLTERTRAIIAVHLYGNMADVGPQPVPVIEDTAQAMGSTLHGRQAGTIGRFGAFSFYPTKNLGALGDAGAIFCASADDAERLRVLRNYGQKDRYRAEVAGGLNSRLDEVQAAVLSVRLRRFAAWNERRALLVARYREQLAGLPLSFQRPTAGCVPAWHLCVIALESQDARTRLQAHLQARGVQTLIHYPFPAHTQPAFQSEPRLSLPITESLAARILSLPMYPALRDDEQAQVIDSLRAFFQR